MREILFRGKILETEFQNVSHRWGKKNGDWVEGFYHVRTECVCGGYEYCECDGFDQHLISVEGEDDYPIVPDTVGQYTGLTDKNGKKVFEGDIVKEPRFVNINNKIEDRSFYFQVKWIDCMLCLSTLQKYADKPCRSILMVDEMEVIGNIHDKCFVEKIKGGEIK